MIYKTLKKVSDYCQILDKSKFSATQTINGVTFTNNGDGSITVNGTASSKAIFTLVNTQVQISRGSKFCLNKPLDTEVYGKFWFEVGMTFADGITHYKADTENSVIEIKRDNVSKIICYIAVGVGYTVNNITFKPQLFDLTEMYGAGNEPTTVEQFRTKFPNELYDYKPYCFVKSYKNCLKVSEYCQLLDKSKFPATKTENGVTWTNNGDGTITVDGTATGLSTYIFGKILIKSNRKYLYCGLDNSTNVLLVYNLFYSDGSFYKSETTNSSIIIDTASIEKGILQVFAKRNNNIPTSGIVKPQLFDLTEMYGAGNEPTTVEQFRTKFPNELYDYKPYSIVPSYKKSLKVTDSILL